jgi:signal transduction histidine kinase
MDENGGFGLFSIGERLEPLGGHMKVASKPGQGTQVTLVGPVIS